MKSVAITTIALIANALNISMRYPERTFACFLLKLAGAKLHYFDLNILRQFQLLRLLPREFIVAEMAVLGGRLIYWPLQVQVPVS